MELVQYTYCLDIGDRQRLREEFEDLGPVAALHPLNRLAFPRDLSLLPAMREAVLKDLSER